MATRSGSGFGYRIGLNCYAPNQAACLLIAAQGDQLDELDQLIVLPTAAGAVEQVQALQWPGSIMILGVDRPGCAGYATHGLDRQAAGFAVAAELAENATSLVLDAGTAITADVWRRSHGRPEWLGGWIIPGSRVAMQGLAAAAPALPPPMNALMG